MKNELQTLWLFSPLFPHIYRKNEWGDIEDYREDLTAGEVLEYEDEILALIQKEKLPARVIEALPFTSMIISAKKYTASIPQWRNIVIFKSRDADNQEQAFKEFTAKKLSREAKPSIRKALSVLREAAGRNVQRAKEKIRERGMER